jgi:succinate-semialdehyde dehydrogenase/glutarate-semialdehyde dehydrogenase
MATTQPAPATAQEMFVAGEWQSSRSGKTFEASSPATGELIGTIPEGDRDDAARAIAAAAGAADAWARLTPAERAAKMHAVGDIIESRRDELARTLTLDQGKPLHAEAYDEVDELVEYWRMAAEDCKRLGGELPGSVSPGKKVLLMRRPRGVVGVISPWNWPYTMPAELIAPALACGNAVVWTPAPSTALCVTRSRATPAPTASRSSARPRRGGSWGRRRPARRRCSRWGATAPWW